MVMVVLRTSLEGKLTNGLYARGEWMESVVWRVLTNSRPPPSWYFNLTVGWKDVFRGQWVVGEETGWDGFQRWLSIHHHHPATTTSIIFLSLSPERQEEVFGGIRDYT